jgi:hypothetical protein
LALGLFKVLLESSLQLRVLGRFGHFGQSLDDLTFGVVGVLKLVKVKVSERDDLQCGPFGGKRNKQRSLAAHCAPPDG